MSLFIAIQYSRQLSYLECKLSNTFKEVALKCDCEEQNNIDLTSHDHPFHKTNHISIDEFFTVAKAHTTHSLIIPTLKDKDFFNVANECEGYTGLLYPPPRS